MIINEMMKIIWAETRSTYLDLLEYASSLSAEELFENVKNKKMTFYSYPGTNMNLLSCSVCTYRIEKDFGGCSMCDYENNDLMHQAYMTALREKNVSLYSKAILNSFANVRGKHTLPNVFELISSYDVFTDKEFPEEVFYEFFKANALFSRKPFGYIFEARASSITKEKLDLVKKYISPKNRVIIEFGVETGNEWLRNHWLNKDVTNAQIINAISLIHEAGFKAAADILIGIPGLTEVQSQNVFNDTIFWLEKAGIDQFVALPLNRKTLTLQGIIYQHLKNDHLLLEMGIAQQEHTGIPWLTTIICSLNEVFTKKPELINKINLAQVYPYQNSVSNITAYNKAGCVCNKILTDVLGKYQIKRDIGAIKKAAEYTLSDGHGCDIDYKDLLRSQANQDIPLTVKSIINQLAPFIWPDSYADIILDFQDEVNQYEDII
ncbi:MAG: radical SAM protein [Lachnospiraceae bacterium]|nr:radical SAM protein [Lachnospiraceae bacterium]